MLTIFGASEISRFENMVGFSKCGVPKAKGFNTKFRSLPSAEVPADHRMNISIIFYIAQVIPSVHLDLWCYNQPFTIRFIGKNLLMSGPTLMAKGQHQEQNNCT